MPASLASSTRSRLTSLALVAGLHVLILLGLGASLVRDALLKPPPGPTEVTVLEPEPPTVEPLPPLRVPHAGPAKPDLPELPLPLVSIETVQPTISVQPVQPEAPPLREPRPGPAALPAEPVAASLPQAAGLLCPTQARPQLPAQATEGSAHLRVLGTVRGGRVVAVQVHSLRALPERRAQRALLAEVEQTLRQGYACSQDGVFEQEFVFRVE